MLAKLLPVDIIEKFNTCNKMVLKNPTFYLFLEVDTFLL